MGFFAVVRHPEAPEFSIETCHINLWSLPGLFRQLFYWDVGLHIRATDGKISKIQLALPFGTEDGSLSDLHDQVCDPKVAQLIFGKPVRTDQAHGKIIIERSDGDLEWDVMSIAQAKCERVVALSSSTFSFWTIELSTPIEVGNAAYVRVRFDVSNIGRTWIWKRSFLGSSGAIVDLRIADVRESWRIERMSEYQTRIVNINRLFLFLIAPASLQYRATSPGLHDLRLHEGRVWENYLQRKTDFGRKGKYVIYQWRNDKDAPISQMDAFRAFIDLSFEYGIPPFRQCLITAFTVTGMLALYALCNQIFQIHHQWFISTWAKTVSSLGGIVGGLTLVTLSTLGIKYFNKWKAAREFWKKHFPKVEKRIFRPPGV
jgi:hypothetical protein